MELVDSVISLLKQRRSEEFFKDLIWKDSQELADKVGVDISLPNAGRRTSLPSRFKDAYVLESTRGRDQAMLSVYQSYKQIYYQVIDKVLMELEHRFGEPRPFYSL